MRSFKRYFILTSILFFGLVNNILSQTYNWENSSTINLLPVETEAYNNNQLIDLTSDNYGTHFIGISNFNSNTFSGNLNYFLFDNNGLIVNNESYIEIETGVRGLSTCSGFGRVFFIAIKDNSIKIYERINGVNGYQLKLTFVPTNPQIYSTYFVNTSLAITEGKLHIVWQSKVPPYGNYYIGYAIYNYYDENINLLPIINDANSLGNHPQIAASGNKVEISYTRVFNNISSQDIFNSVDVSNAPTYIVRTASGWITPSNNEAYTRSALLIKDNTSYILGKTSILDLGQLGTNLQFKNRSFAGGWPTFSNTIEFSVNGYNTKPSLIYVPENNRIGFTYEAMYSTNELRYREYDIQNQTLLTPVTCQTAPWNEYIYFSLLRSSIHGDYILFRMGNNFKKIRRPRTISGYITYNTLLTGTEYINSSISTDCHSNGAKIIAESGSTTTVASNSQFYIDQGDGLELKSGSTLNILDNAQLIVDGSYASLKLNPNVSINLGTNAKIIIRNGAYLDANGANFAGVNGASWQGIEFDHSAGNNIRYCNFNNASTSLKFLCDPANESTSSNISDNTFNIPGAQTGSYTYGIYSQDMNYVGIGSNIFNMQQGNMSVGLCMKFTNSTTTSRTNSYYKILIYGNHFESGRIGMVLMSYASALKPYFIYNNIFNTTGSSIAEYGIATRKAIGEIKKCSFSPLYTNSDLTITQSSLSLTDNTFGAIYNNINSTAGTIIGIAPGLTANEIILTGGYNVFSSSNSDNIMMGGNQTLEINNGYNCFQSHGSGKLHLNGGLDVSGTIYDANNNYWNTQIPDYYLYNNQDPPQNITLNYTQLTSCQTLSLSIHQIIDRGNGLFDTIYKSQKPTNVYVPPDEVLYNQAYSYLNYSAYPTAILNFKSLIDGYSASSFLHGALYDLYSTYESLDTSNSQSYKDNLYSDLKTYLTEKINSKNYDDVFNDIAYNIILMCETNIGNYNDALTGYQFIAMYHPDAIARLMASWDYTEVEALFSGMGGSDKENVSEDKYIFDLTNKLEGVITKDSTLKSLKNQYLKETERKNVQLNSVLTSNDMVSKSKAIKQKEKDELLIKQSVNVLMTSKNLTKEQKIQKQLDDIFLISTNKQQGRQDNIENCPKEYSLSQNYPNPFNPVTKINFALPKQGFVTLKIYDITGKEIKTLINEVKQAGNYTVDFNGSSLSSGVYFYRIQSGSFVQTKRMVLIK